MSTIKFVVRDPSGILQNGSVIDSSINGNIILSSGAKVSLNARRLDVVGYMREGGDLVLVMANGNRIVLEDYFGADGNPQAELYLNEGGHLIYTEVSATGTVTHAAVEEWGKWGELSSMAFPDDPIVSADGSVAGVAAGGVAGGGVAGGEEVSMVAGFGLAPLAGIGGSGAVGGAVAGAGLLGGAALVGTAVLGGSEGGSASGGGNSTGPGGWGGGGTDTGTGGTTRPSVDRPGDAYTYNLESDHKVTITGTGEPGSGVIVVIGDRTVTGTVGGDGRWKVDFDGTDFPGEGEHNVFVRVTGPDGTVTDLSGPSVNIDMTPPDVAIAGYGGTIAGNVVNAVEHETGFMLTGTGEAGAAIAVQVNGVTLRTVVSQDGTWSVDFAKGDLVSGDYETPVRVSATDSHGNVSVTYHTMVVDTVAPSVAFGPGRQAGDNIVNADEAASGIEITGMAEPGATVRVTMAGKSHTTTALANGTWRVTFAEADVAPGEYSVPLRAVATDAAGNSTTTRMTLHVDTEGNLTLDDGAGAGGAYVVNGATQASGDVTLSGMAEPGAQVEVRINGATYQATVARDGGWSVDVAGANFAPGDYDTRILVTSTDAAGNVSRARGTVLVDTETAVGIDDGIGGRDGVVNRDERDGSVSFSGTGEPGAEIKVNFLNRTRDVTVGPDGTWSATWAAADIPSGEYHATLTVVARDAAGNIDTARTIVAVDTNNAVAAMLSGTGADGILNDVEMGTGVTVTGSGDPEATVHVTIGTTRLPAAVDMHGNWSVTFADGTIPEGTHQATVLVHSVDRAGNVTELTQTLDVDTEVAPFTHGGPVDNDGVVNAEEALDGVTLTGTVEPGSVVSVRLGLVSRNAVVRGDGSWSVDFAAGEIPPGERGVPVTVTATDPARNRATITDTLAVDTLVNELSLTSQMGGDGFVNAKEAAMGLTLTGTVEAGSSVIVKLGGTSHAAQVDANGDWSVDFSAAEVGTGDRTLTATVTATDRALNTRTITQSARLDTVAPDAPEVTVFFDTGNDLQGFSVDHGNATAMVSTLAADGTTSTVNVDAFANRREADWVDLYLPDDLPDGKHLVITNTDAAGNRASTLLALDKGLPDAIDLANPGLAAMDIEAIDLRFAEDSTLTIDSDLLEGLSANSNSLVIHGTADDSVTIDTSNGARLTYTGSRTINNEGYSVYSLGSEGGELIIDEHINIT